MSVSDASAWTSLALIPATAAAGWVLRRWAAGAFSVRLRPHFVLGYIALLAALIHTMLAMPATGAENVAGMWFAALAVSGLVIQSFLGLNLQSPGVYRRPLHRWHTALFWGTAMLALMHVVLNAA